VRSEAKAEVVHAAAEEAGVAVETVLLDIDDAEGAAAVIDEIRPWGLVNNAGFISQAKVEEVDDDQARRHLETMLVAPVRLARLALPHMREQGGGRIIQVSSISGRVTFPLIGWYQASKHALEAISDALRLEVASSGVAVVLIEPGAFPSSDDVHAQYKWLGMLQSSAGSVAKVVVDSLTTRSPRARYVVGLDAKLNAMTAPISPTIVRDAALRLINRL
jgi:NAD(P)-dependent dehydrogenase (short-subunit alcohol dehydrogenase family)